MISGKSLRISKKFNPIGIKIDSGSTKNHSPFEAQEERLINRSQYSVLHKLLYFWNVQNVQRNLFAFVTCFFCYSRTVCFYWTYFQFIQFSYCCDAGDIVSYQPFEQSCYIVGGYFNKNQINTISKHKQSLELFIYCYWSWSR